MENLQSLFSHVPYCILNKDCIDMLKNMPDNSVDLFLTDPPYNLGLFMKNRRQTNLAAMRSNFFGAAGWDDLEFEEWKSLIDLFFKESARVSKYGASMVIFMSIIKVETILHIASKYDFYYKTTGIWHKTNPMPRNMNLHFINSTEAWIYFTYKKHTGVFNNNGKPIHDFFETSVTPSNEKRFGKHPTQKPIALLEEFVRLLSNKDDVICDPFCGSGSSGVAAILNGRKYLGCDINLDYCNIAENRIKELINR